MAKPTPHTFAAGEEVTSDNLNSLTDAINYVDGTILQNVMGVTVGEASVTAPTGGGIGTATVTGLTTPGTNFAVFVCAATSAPGPSGVEEVSVSGVSGTGFTVNMYRVNDTGTGVYWLHVGYA